MARSYFERLGHALVAKNLRLLFTELDLLFLSPRKELVVVEVKSVSDQRRAWGRLISQDQLRRLKKAYYHLQSSSPLAVRVHFAAVNHEDEVTVFEDFLAGSIR